MSGADPAAATRPRAPHARATQRYGTIVVVGGGCYGSYYVRQLERARAAGALQWRHLRVVDRAPDCRVAGELRALQRPTPGADAELVVSDWRAFFAGYLGAASASPDTADADAIVPSPLMPHLLSDWLLERARERWPHRMVGTRALHRAPPMPWQRASPDGTHYVSFAEWTCPVNCIEPRLCPHTGGARDWSMPPAVRAYVEAERARGQRVEGPLVFHCTHRAYGVGMIDTSSVVEADVRLREIAAQEPAEVLVGTVSHCHGALTLLCIGG